jgi:plasmid maintenance system antidote protein VapI
MENVKRLIAAGVRPATAIKESLGMSVSEFSDLHKIPRGTTSEVINGNRKGTPAQLAALSKQLGGSPDEWELFLWEVFKPDRKSGLVDKTTAPRRT